MAKINEIRYIDLARFLERLGYVCRKHDDAHIVWEHSQYERASLSLPAYHAEELVWHGNIGQVRSVLDVHGVLSHDDFDRWRLNLHGSDGAPANGRKEPPRKGRKRTGKSGAATP